MASFPAAIVSIAFAPAAGKALPYDVVLAYKDEIIAIETYLRAGWLPVAFNAGNFTASGAMTWTLTSPDQILFVYRLLDPFTLAVAFQFDQTSVGGTPSTNLRIPIPAGKTAAYAVSAALARTIDNNVVTSGYAQASGTLIVFSRSDAANWAAAANTTYVSGQLIIPITG